MPLPIRADEPVDHRAVHDRVARCERDLQVVVQQLDLSSVKPLKQEIIEAYGEQIRDPRTMLSVLRTNQAYDAILAPLVPVEGGYLIDKNSRAFQEDVACGLATLVQMARRLELHLPHIEEIFGWSVSYMGGVRHSARDHFPTHWPA